MTIALSSPSSNRRLIMILVFNRELIENSIITPLLGFLSWYLENFISLQLIASILG
jgi:hypothetical protein